MSNTSDRELRQIPRVDYRLLNSVGFTEGAAAAAAAEIAVESVDQVTSSDSEFFSGCDSPERSSSNSCHELDTTAVAVTEVEGEPGAQILREMANPRITQLVAELETIMFQLKENSETVTDELATMQLKDCNELYEETKELRVTMVKYNRELVLLNTDNDAKLNYGDEVTKLCAASKADMKTIKFRIAGLETQKEQFERDRLNEVKSAEVQKNLSKKLAFERLSKEVETMYVKLNQAFTAPAVNLSRDAMLRRKEEKPALALEFDRFRERADRLICDTEAQFDGKEDIVRDVIRLSGILEKSKTDYDNKVYNDLLTNDLTDDKLKLAEQTTIDIGKFSGAAGEDFYTFKSKFLKVYTHHPKSLMVEFLKNNHLTGKAKQCVGSLEDVDNIWKRLKDNFGNTEQMLLHHFSTITKMGSMSKRKSYTDKKHYLQALINSLQDALDLATEHDLTGELHYGPQLGKIVGLLETYLQNGWYKIISEESVAKPVRWLRLIVYLEAQLSIIQTRAFETESEELKQQTVPKDDEKPPKGGKGSSGYVTKATPANGELCKLCDDKHPSANKAFWSCKIFLLMSFKERGDLVRKKQHCLQCLDVSTKWRDPNHSCTTTYVCPHDSHGKFEKKLHILLCGPHAKDEENKNLFEVFKSEMLTANWQQKIIKSLVSWTAVCLKTETPKLITHDNGLPDATNAPASVFILQPVPFNGRVFNWMFDTGCQDFVSRKAAIDGLPDDCKENIIKGPIIIHGVGGAQVTSQHGHFLINFPIHDGRLAKFSGITLDVVTGAMPPYPVREARKEIVEGYKAQGGKISKLPQVPAIVGGDTDFLLGIRYNYFQPRMLFILPSGLAIYESIFKGVDETRGCVGGSSEIFQLCEKQFMDCNNMVLEFKVYIQQQLQLFRNGYKVCIDCTCISSSPTSTSHPVSIVNEDVNESSAVVLFSARKRPQISTEEAGTRIEYRCIGCHCRSCDHVDIVMLSDKKRLHNEAEDAGSIIEYRCIKCRNCTNCKNSEHVEKVSLREEFEQHLVDTSVEVNFETGTTSALLPFIADPTEKLASNEENALRIYRQQIKKLAKNPELLKAVLESELKLQRAGHVEWKKNLSSDQLQVVEQCVGEYFIPWRMVENENSITTPVRVVFDASSVSRSGYSLNDVLAKGMNSMNSMLSIFLMRRCYKFAVHTDVTKMYNVVRLKPEHWTYQRYKWHETLDPDEVPLDKFILSLIYGVKPSGNQAQVGLRETARRQQEDYPEAADAIINDTYVDDCATGVSGFPTDITAEKLASDITTVLAKGGFVTKGFTISGQPPDVGLSKDGVSINVFGTKWIPALGKIQLNIGPLNFTKKHRGKKSQSEDSYKIPDKLTKKICAGKVGEVFDLVGLVAPIVGGFKLNIRELVVSCCGWEDKIPDQYRSVWLSNFELMEIIGDLVYNRAVVPADASSLDVELISAGDASEQMACACCYIRFKRKDNSYSCQLLLAKTKLVPEDTTLPRAELFAATLNIHVSQIVKKSLKYTIVDHLLVLDSEIALYWLSSFTKQLKPWVRNRVIEILRFSDPGDWYHVNSDLNPADLGTRGGVSVEDCGPESEWINGMPYMSLPMVKIRELHVQSVSEIYIRNEQLIEIKKESMKPANSLCTSDFHLVTANVADASGCYLVGDGTVDTSCFIVNQSVFGCYPVSNASSEIDTTAKVRERLQFSNYLINPNKYRFYKVVRIIAMVLKSVKAWLQKIGKKLHCFSYPLRMLDSQLIPTEEVTCSATGVVVTLTDAEVQYSMDYFFRKATEEVKEFVDAKVYQNISVEQNNILYYSARVSPSDVKFKCTMTDAMIDLSAGTFIVPIVDRHSPLAYGIVNQIHWYHPTASHKGVESTIREVMTVAHIFGVRDLAKLFRKHCARCRYLLKMTLEVQMSPASEHQVCVAPPYYVTQADICGPYKAYSKHNQRATIKVWILAFVCSTTSMTNLKVMDSYDTTQFLQAFSRFACEAGFPKMLLVDAGSQLISGCENMVLNMIDLKGVLNREYGIQFDVCPVGGHNYRGKVERKIKAVRESVNKAVNLQRLSVLQWETLSAEIANSINNHPIAIGNETEDLECLDLITPNRLRLGRNNDRSPIGSLDISNGVDRILNLNSDIFNAWWEAWLVSALPKVVPQPKWYKTDEHLKLGDIVLFRESEGSIVAGRYKYGIVDEVQESADGRIRSATIRYRNATEDFDRTTNRAVRSLVVIHRVDELDLMEELGKPMCNASV